MNASNLNANSKLEDQKSADAKLREVFDKNQDFLGRGKDDGAIHDKNKAIKFAVEDLNLSVVKVQGWFREYQDKKLLADIVDQFYRIEGLAMKKCQGKAVYSRYNGEPRDVYQSLKMGARMAFVATKALVPAELLESKGL